MTGGENLFFAELLYQFGAVMLFMHRLDLSNLKNELLLNT